MKFRVPRLIPRQKTLSHLYGTLRQIQLSSQFAPPRPANVVFLIKLLFQPRQLISRERRPVPSDVRVRARRNGRRRRLRVQTIRQRARAVCQTRKKTVIKSFILSDYQQTITSRPYKWPVRMLECCGVGLPIVSGPGKLGVYEWRLTFDVMLGGVRALRWRRLVRVEVVVRRYDVEDDRRRCLDVLVVAPEAVLLHGHVGTKRKTQEKTRCGAL